MQRRVGITGRTRGARAANISIADVVAAYEQTGSSKAAAAKLGVSHMVEE